MNKNWLDAEIGWSKEFNVITTVLPDDPAVDADASDFDAYYEDNLSMEHLRMKEGQEPVKMEIRLPSPSQWASVIPLIRGVDQETEGSLHVVALKLFELCVRFPKMESMAPSHRDGFKRLPEKAMTFFAAKKPHHIELVGNFIISKYLMTDEEKKAS